MIYTRIERDQYGANSEFTSVPTYASLGSIVSSFRYRWYFLSNFYRCRVPFRGFMFYSSEAAFQACKCWDRAEEFSHYNPKEAKRVGATIIAEDWRGRNEDVMREVLWCKFSTNEVLAHNLMDLEGYTILEGNSWGDTHWGVSRGEGDNRLGRLLMETRDRLKGVYPDYVPEVPKQVRFQNVWLIDWSIINTIQPCFCNHVFIGLLIEGKNGSAYALRDIIPDDAWNIKIISDNLHVVGYKTRYATQEEIDDNDLYALFTRQDSKLLRSILEAWKRQTN